MFQGGIEMGSIVAVCASQRRMDPKKDVGEGHLSGALDPAHGRHLLPGDKGGVGEERR